MSTLTSASGYSPEDSINSTVYAEYIFRGSRITPFTAPLRLRAAPLRLEAASARPSDRIVDVHEAEIDTERGGEAPAQGLHAVAFGCMMTRGIEMDA